MKRINSYGQGDHYVNVKIRVPPVGRLTPHQRHLMAAWSETEEGTLSGVRVNDVQPQQQQQQQHREYDEDDDDVKMKMKMKEEEEEEMEKKKKKKKNSSSSSSSSSSASGGE